MSSWCLAYIAHFPIYLYTTPLSTFDESAPHFSLEAFNNKYVKVLQITYWTHLFSLEDAGLFAETFYSLTLQQFSKYCTKIHSYDKENSALRSCVLYWIECCWSPRCMPGGSVCPSLRREEPHLSVCCFGGFFFQLKIQIVQERWGLLISKKITFHVGKPCVNFCVSLCLENLLRIP